MFRLEAAWWFIPGKTRGRVFLCSNSAFIGCYLAGKTGFTGFCKW